MPHLRTLSIAAAAACIAALAVPELAPAAEPRSDGPAQLARLLARYDAMKPGPARDELALEIDRFAGQRHATVSRLYWYQSLEAAKTAAYELKRPILHLRMLGRLDEDLSCANSRFFRTTLYANRETARFLRDNFVLVWSSERPVPRVTIDFGDGRKLERTTTGNSAHYVLDEHGDVLDVLPGVYAPAVFRAELAKSAALAKQVRGMLPDARRDAVVAFHTAALKARDAQFAKVAGTDYIRRRGRLLTAVQIGAGALGAAQRATMTKMAVEVPDLQKIGFDVRSVDRADLEQWATIGQLVWKIGLGNRTAGPHLLDASSVALVEKLRAGNPRAGVGDTDHVVARLEQHILADTALNELRLRQDIRRFLVRQRTLEWARVNDHVYANVFHTPRSDAWLGLLEATDFTGLPADGVVMP